MYKKAISIQNAIGNRGTVSNQTVIHIKLPRGLLTALKRLYCVTLHFVSKIIPFLNLSTVITKCIKTLEIQLNKIHDGNQQNTYFVSGVMP